MNSIKSLSSVRCSIHAGALALAAIAVAYVSSLSGEPQPGPAGPAFVGLGAFDQPFPRRAGNSFARGLSANGKVVVGYVKSGPSSNPVEHAFRWSKNDGMQGIPDNPPYTRSEATAVSANGEIIVGFSDLIVPFRWTLASGMVDLPLGAPPSGATLPAGRAWGVSGDGNVIVGERYACKFFGDSSWWATRWVGQTPPADLGHLPEVVSLCDDRFARALGASADGSTIVGQTFVDIDLPFAFRWNASDGVMTKMEATKATAVSADGTVIVGSGPAFRWTQANGMQAMGQPPGAAKTFPLAVSPDGSVVAGKATRSDDPTPNVPPASYEAMIWDTDMIWDTEGTVRWLQPWLEEVNGMPDELQDWTLHEVVGVGANSDWLYFAGNGTNPAGEFEAWWARVPKPGPDIPTGRFRVPLLFDREPYIIICDPAGPHGPVQFAVLGTKDFDPRTLVRKSIRFGNASAAKARTYAYRDVNRDGLTDLALQFNLQDVYRGMDWRNTKVLRFLGTTTAKMDVLGKIAVQPQIR